MLLLIFFFSPKNLGKVASFTPFHCLETLKHRGVDVWGEIREESRSLVWEQVCNTQVSFLILVYADDESNIWSLLKTDRFQKSVM